MSPRRLVLLVLTAVLLALAPAPAGATDESPIGVHLVGPVEAVAEGEPVVVVLHALRADGEPVPGLTVTFTRRSMTTGPDGVTTTAVTDEAGTARLEMPFEQQAVVMASVHDAAGAHVGTATVSLGSSCRCSPPVPALSARGVQARNGDDRLLLRTHQLPAGAVVDLFRVTGDGQRVDRIRRSRVDEHGRRAWRVTDHNGRAATRYYVVALPTEQTPRARTPIVWVR
ncbi:hypothetical protein [Nocardioides marmotae]|uniref:hypothetical protein n=1 Tax=Nocardioides marmotae TaxID=2663857 RepID=UPI0012B55E17|nr:hypothetical protein [Nocardioides marmotae]MBC9734131.1 hypothetical protein [Nocardioides marmotae]MTB85234.1 hypothetical protein [Nocardioides marmotae]